MVKNNCIPDWFNIENIKMSNLADNLSMQLIESQIKIGENIFNSREIEGDILEIGCNKGKTSLHIRKVMNLTDSKKTLHVYDSFEGFSKPNVEKGEEHLREGDLKVSKTDVLETFLGSGFKPPIIHEGNVLKILDTNLPDKISVVLIDCDLYDPIIHSLRLVSKKLSIGGIIMVHDYNHKNFPGVKKAVNEFLNLNNDIFDILDTDLFTIRRKIF